MAKKTRFSKALAMLTTVFDDKNLDTAAVKIYYEILKDYSIADIENAVTTILRTRTHHTMPTPAEIAEVIEGPAKNKAVVAWAAVEKALKTTGVYQGVKFSDPAIHSAIDMLGGWEVLCSATTYDMPRLRADFMCAYQAAKEEKLRKHPELVKGLLGQADKPVQIDVPVDHSPSDRPSPTGNKPHLRLVP